MGRAHSPLHYSPMVGFVWRPHTTGHQVKRAVSQGELDTSWFELLPQMPSAVIFFVCYLAAIVLLSRRVRRICRLTFLDDVIALLHWQQDTAQIHLNRPSSAHVHSLPPEILSEIFLSAQGDTNVGSPKHVPNQNPLNPDALPWLICRVCQRWRYIAETQLWQALDVHLNNKDIEAMAASPCIRVPHAQDTIGRWLHVALHRLKDENGGLPRPASGPGLQVTVRFGEAATFGTGHAAQLDHIATYLQFAMLSTLFMYSNHCRLLRLEIRFHLLRALGKIPRGQLQRLEALHLLIDEMSPSAIPAAENIELFREAPKLRSLEISGLVRLFWDKLPLPWHQLHECSIKEAGGFIHQNESLLALKIGIAMSRCRIKAGFLDIRNSIRDLRIVNESLVRLEYLNVYPTVRNEGHLFQHLELPNLKEVCLDVGAQKGSYAATHEMIRRSCAKLHSLDLRCPLAEEVAELGMLLFHTAATLKTLTLHLSFRNRSDGDTSVQSLRLLTMALVRPETRCEKLALILTMPDRTPPNLEEKKKLELVALYDTYVQGFADIVTASEKLKCSQWSMTVYIRRKDILLTTALQNAVKKTHSCNVLFR
ncbi:hypothetical protein VNI00_016607 [Paramarasmius palmivorus]|uniref:F-box domain-containing protein n=1 Tax=Paramarasmius palmivorus TaxID=297713 RepID=A0AAW0BCP6_9AGAR